MLKSVQRKIEKKPKTITCSCGGEMERIHDQWKYFYEVGNEERELNVYNAPFYKCKTCHEVVLDVFLFAEVEKAIEEEIFLRLNNRQEIPNEVDFAEFIN
ncbi:hypothetical protein [Caldifermentibacillus hisashii]|nr:hypothetical protein [Caldifermentibacillus hisashii]